MNVAPTEISAMTTSAGRTLRLLHAEDEPNDALLCQLQLEEAGLSIQADVVAHREDFVDALQGNTYDLVLTDYKLPGWSGMEVLKILKADGRDIPCILVTGSVGEEIAAKCIKQGATDYILKDRPARLPFAIESALQERSDRARRQEAERSRSRLASIVESSPDAIIGASDQGLIVDWNPGAESLFGYKSEEVYGSPLANLFADHLLPGRGLIQRYETKGSKKTGEVMDLAVTISPISNSEGTVTGSSAIVRDITEAKRQQAELLTTQKLEAIGALAGGVAHDFNNLLTVINGYARMLQKKGSADPAKLDAILQAGERGQRLTKQLLLFSRKQITQLKPLNLNALILGFMDMLRPLIGADIKLETELDPDIAPILADSGQMEQVIMNLVVNARDAMPEGGTVTIETKNRRDSDVGEFGAVIMSVRDTGMGMSPEVQARIFEPFFTTKEAGRGTGLGLSTSFGIIARCNGKVCVESEVGRGTTFIIQLPACARANPESEELSAQAETAVAVGCGTILLAEDDATVRGFVLSVLQDRGYQVLAAENGAKALEICSTYKGPIHALVTDVVMPEMNGRTLADKARQLRPNLQVLFVSGYVDRGLRDEDISSGSNAFLEKPFSGEALLKIVGDFCAQGAAQ
jgi:PAS domain S-box-containing protein